MSATPLHLVGGGVAVLAIRVVAEETSVPSTYEVPATGMPGRFTGAGMALKLVAACEALAGEVASVRMTDGRAAHQVSRALAGSGTTVTTNARFGHRPDQNLPSGNVPTHKGSS